MVGLELDEVRKSRRGQRVDALDPGRAGEVPVERMREAQGVERENVVGTDDDQKGGVVVTEGAE